MELFLKKNVVRFDVNDVSMSYASVLKNKFNNDRKTAEETCFIKLISILKIVKIYESKMNFILKNWSVILLADEKVFRKNKKLQNEFIKLIYLKAYGDEEEYILKMQRSKEFKMFLTNVIIENKIT